jgi:hypothetical protein
MSEEYKLTITFGHGHFRNYPYHAQDGDLTMLLIHRPASNHPDHSSFKDKYQIILDQDHDTLFVSYAVGGKIWPYTKRAEDDFDKFKYTGIDNYGLFLEISKRTGPHNYPVFYGTHIPSDNVLTVIKSMLHGQFGVHHFYRGDEEMLAEMLSDDPIFLRNTALKSLEHTKDLYDSD